MIYIIINSFDDTIYYSIICKNTDDFYKIKKEFYKAYSQYSETNNFLYVKRNINHDIINFETNGNYKDN